MVSPSIWIFALLSLALAHAYSLHKDETIKRNDLSRDILSFGKRSANLYERDLMSFGKRNPYTADRDIMAFGKRASLYNSGKRANLDRDIMSFGKRSYADQYEAPLKRDEFERNIMAFGRRK